MTAFAYYSEHDAYAAQWLRNLMKLGVIAPGFVDERSIEDVRPSDLRGFHQHHFFAGVGVWSFALRRAGVTDDCRVWTGSCPCQPFSAAGQRTGTADKRHLWPHFHFLIEQCRPGLVLGEQVASRDAEPWVQLVQDDLEGLGYAFGATTVPAACVGAPHIRDRLYWCGVALGDAGHPGLPFRQLGAMVGARWREEGRAIEQPSGAPRSVADANGGHAGTERQQPGGEQRQQQQEDGGVGRLGHPLGTRVCGESGGLAGAQASIEDRQHRDEPRAASSTDRPGPTNGFWRDADWIFCRDGKWRPIEPGLEPLASGPSARMGLGGADWRTPAGTQGFGHRANRLKGYGNALNAEAALAFVQSLLA